MAQFVRKSKLDITIVHDDSVLLQWNAVLTHCISSSPHMYTVTVNLAGFHRKFLLPHVIIGRLLHFFKSIFRQVFERKWKLSAWVWAQSMVSCSDMDVARYPLIDEKCVFVLWIPSTLWKKRLTYRSNFRCSVHYCFI